VALRLYAPLPARSLSTLVRQLRDLVVGVFDGRPVFLKDVAQVEDGPDETAGYVRHGWGPARGFTKDEYFPSTILGESAHLAANSTENGVAQPAVTIAVAKKKGSNAVWVADAVLRQAEELQRKIVPSDIEMIVTRNYGLTANEKVNGLLEGLAVAILIVVALLTIGLGWREALIVAVAVPVVRTDAGRQSDAGLYYQPSHALCANPVLGATSG
jgi:multidrug efflux pump subunit AcrB